MESPTAPFFYLLKAPKPFFYFSRTLKNLKLFSYLKGPPKTLLFKTEKPTLNPKPLILMKALILSQVWDLSVSVFAVLVPAGGYIRVLGYGGLGFRV